MTAELLRQVRESREKQRQPQEEQKEVNRICAGMRLACDELLTRYGQRETNWPNRFRLFLTSHLDLLFRKMSPFEYADQKRLEVPVSKNGKNLKVTLLSSSAVPSKSWWIDITTQESDEVLRLTLRFGEHSSSIYSLSGGFLELPLLQPREIPRESRPVNLEDVRRWDEVIRAIQQQYPLA